ncbi:hypothetical protein [Leekyejoonella antrihumi]|uniref:DUF4244 domain-containing protein n=1 Tax=Leekyejoonella antrihumi TaxID=1660198 RepID=A0A563E162_9MICO|nr:hypothetical protein [Leekyejoonella antrihumi]TWP35951.1 hypothetical protein FGL98_12015 [Leekyejoonella antrihumi]
MTRALIATRVRIIKAVEGRDEKGQGTLEYVGMIALAALLVGAIVTAFGSGTALSGEVTKAINKISTIMP